MPVPEDNLILLGKIIKVHGYQGNVVINLEDYLPDEIPNMEWVFIEIDKKPVPFFVSSVNISASGIYILKFDGYDSSDVMTEFIGCKVLVNQDVLGDKKQISSQLIYTGFKVFDQQDNYIGLVEKVMILPMQYMLVIHDSNDKELLIPLNQDWIIEINKDAKTIVMNLPDGIKKINE